LRRYVKGTDKNWRMRQRKEGKKRERNESERKKYKKMLC
jgi:hypothetical protein